MHAEQTRLDAIDGWRTLSVLFVILAHLSLNSAVAYDGSGALANMIIWPMLVELGPLGVYIFFLISGFVICRGMIAETGKTGRMSAGPFYVRRVFRIVPPLLLYLTTVFVLSTLGVVESSWAIFRPLTFTCNLGSVEAIEAACGGVFGAHTWSLSVEEQFYVVMPMLWLFCVRGRALAMQVGLAVVALVWLAVLLSGRGDGASIAYPFIPISLGIVCAFHEAKLRRIFGRSGFLAAILSVAATVALMRLLSTRLQPAAAALLPLAIGGMLFSTIFSETPIRRWLSHPIFVAVGRSSYGIYLWQQLATASYDGAGWLFYAGTVTASLIGPVVLFGVFDKPLINIGRKLSDKISGTRGPAEATLRELPPVDADLT